MERTLIGVFKKKGKTEQKRAFGSRNRQKGSTKRIIDKRLPHMSGSVPAVV